MLALSPAPGVMCLGFLRILMFRGWQVWIHLSMTVCVLVCVLISSQMKAAWACSLCVTRCIDLCRSILSQGCRRGPQGQKNLQQQRGKRGCKASKTTNAAVQHSDQNSQGKALRRALARRLVHDQMRWRKHSRVHRKHQPHCKACEKAVCTTKNGAGIEVC